MVPQRSPGEGGPRLNQRVEQLPLRVHTATCEPLPPSKGRADITNQSQHPFHEPRPAFQAAVPRAHRRCPFGNPELRLSWPGPLKVKVRMIPCDLRVRVRTMGH